MIAAALPLALAGCGICLRGTPGCQPPLAGWQDAPAQAYEPDLAPVNAPQLPAWNPEPVHIPLDASGQFDGSRGNGCPGIPLPGSPYCIVPGQ